MIKRAVRLYPILGTAATDRIHSKDMDINQHRNYFWSCTCGMGEDGMGSTNIGFFVMPIQEFLNHDESCTNILRYSANSWPKPKAKRQRNQGGKSWAVLRLSLHGPWHYLAYAENDMKPWTPIIHEYKWSPICGWLLVYHWLCSWGLHILGCFLAQRIKKWQSFLAFNANSMPVRMGPDKKVPTDLVLSAWSQSFVYSLGHWAGKSGTI